MSATNQLCEGKIDLKSYLFLNKLCEDCFSLFRDPDIYAACRQVDKECTGCPKKMSLLSGFEFSTLGIILRTFGTKKILGCLAKF